jgi:Ca2+/Na+ antiporter
LLFVVIGTAFIVFGAEFLVSSGKTIAAGIGISETIIGFTVIALGTSLPELVTTLTAIRKKESSLSVGNIIGANIIDTTLILPLCAVINGKPLPIKETQRMNKIKPKEYQLFECPICKKRSIPGVTSNIVIDHNHINGNARAWICDSCNTGLGRFKDNQDVLKRAINYLNSFSK